MGDILPDPSMPKRTEHPSEQIPAKLLATAPRRRLLILSIIFVIALISTIVAFANANLEKVGVDDFIEYWSAGRLNMTGGNPYSPSQMMEKESGVGWDEQLPLMMWNLPLTLALVMPFGLLPYLPARLLWLLVSGALILVASDRLWRLYGGAAEKRGLAPLLAISFMPALFLLHIGQIGVWIMVGVVGFLLFAKRERWLATGAFFALTLIKPHVVYLVWVSLALWWLSRPRWKFAVGGIAAVAIAWLIATLVNPQVTAQYLDATLHTPPLYWRTMTWGTILRLLFGVERDWLQLVAPAIGLTWLAYWWLQHRRQWNWRTEMPLLLLVSASTMAFGWFFDLVVLLPVVMQIGVWLSEEKDRRLRRTVVAGYLLLQLLALAVNMARLDAPYYIWFTPSLLLLYLFFRAHRQPYVIHKTLESRT